MQGNETPNPLQTGDSPAVRAVPATEIPPPLGPHFWSVARRSRWIGVLLLVLAVASAFAFLGRWQLERAITPEDDTQTEAPVALDSLAQPQQPGAGTAYWRMVDVDDLEYVPGDSFVLSGRTNTGSAAGYWVVAHTLVPGGASLAVALGWTPSESDARSVVDALDGAAGDAPLDLGAATGRYLPPESPQASDYRHGERSALSTAELVNLWRTAPTDAGTYGGYLTLRTPPALVADDLAAIDSPPPIPQDQVNLLNLFYAVEWVIFAAAAVFIWWRLVRDAELKELGIDLRARKR